MKGLQLFLPFGGGAARMSGRRQCNRMVMIPGLFVVLVITGCLLSLSLLSKYHSSDSSLLLMQNQYSDNLDSSLVKRSMTAPKHEQKPQSWSGIRMKKSNDEPLLMSSSSSLLTSSTPSLASSSSSSCFLEAFDLSVNQLQVIPFWDGALASSAWTDESSQGEATSVATMEDFLPIVTPMGEIDLRFRLRPKPTTVMTRTKEEKHSKQQKTGEQKNHDGRGVNKVSYHEAIKGISAYQIIAEMAHSPHETIWDSGKVPMNNGHHNNQNAAFASSWLPSFIEWDTRAAPLVEGTIVRWRVKIWDALGYGPSSSDWSKFGVGPDTHNWIAKWITHPMDYATLLQQSKEDAMTKSDNNSGGNNNNTAASGRGSDSSYNNKRTESNQKQPRTRDLRDLTVSKETCNLWKQRMPLPLARVQFTMDSKRKDEITGALLVASGVGMFSVTMNGKRLSSSSVHDPPLTNFAQRVSYRGFDVTHELTGQNSQQEHHTVGITLAPGWWDHRPINGNIVFMDFMPKGSPSAIAQLHVTYRDGTTEILIPTGGGGGGGVGEHDEAVTTASGKAAPSKRSSLPISWKMGKGSLMESNLYTGEKIDLALQHKYRGWDRPSATNVTTNASPIDWVDPQLYKGVDRQNWRVALKEFAVDGKQQTILSELGPVGPLVPLEIPPVLPVDKIAPSSIIRLGSRDDGRWLLDFGRGMSGVVRFEKGLPEPIVPAMYPRAHNLSVTMNNPETDRYISVVYGDSLEMSTGDINLALVAGFGHHKGGERGKIQNPNQPPLQAGPCFPPEDLIGYQALTQRDVFIVPGNHHGSSTRKLFREARQASFTVHGFRYAEVCCSEEPPTDVYAIQYRTAFPVWGKFDSSNPVFNGGKLCSLEITTYKCRLHCVLSSSQLIRPTHSKQCMK